MLIAPSSVIACCRRAISPCRAPGRVFAPGSWASAASSAPASASCCANCSHGEPRRLLLQPQIARAFAERRQLLLAGHPLLVRGPQPFAGLVLSGPGHGQALLALDPDPERFLEREPEPLVLEPREFGFGLRPIGLGLFELFRNSLN